MKKNILLILFLGFTVISFGQDIETVKIKQPMCDEIEGLSLGTLIPSNYAGVVKECSDGKVKELANYKDGKKDGLQRWWNDNGQLYLEGYFKNGKKQIRMFYENGQLFSEEATQDGKEDGLQRWWNDNGQLQSECSYKYGKKDGWERSWYDNGQLQSEYNYKEGDLISHKCWDEDGKKINCHYDGILKK
jgi:hypothetical protein